MSAHEKALTDLKHMLRVCETEEITLGAAGLVSTLLRDSVAANYFDIDPKWFLRLSKEARASLTISRLRVAAELINGSEEVAEKIGHLRSSFDSTMESFRNLYRAHHFSDR